jgi:hypothetical protein
MHLIIVLVLSRFTLLHCGQLLIQYWCTCGTLAICLRIFSVTFCMKKPVRLRMWCFWISNCLLWHRLPMA